MKEQTILQKITDTLETAGINVSGIETWPPEEDGRISVSMTIRPRPELGPEYADLYAFIETYLEYDDSCCESVKTIYEKYTNCQTVEPLNKLSEFRFIKNVIGYFAARGKEVKYFSSTDARGKNDPCLSNIRFILLEEARYV